MSELPKRNIKDSVFTNLFQDTKYVARLYNALHPYENISEDVINIETLKTVMQTVSIMTSDLLWIKNDFTA